MEPLETQVRPDDPRFRENDAVNRALADELRARLQEVRRGGGEKAQTRHREQKKLFVRDRLERLLDPGAPFLELSPLAAFVMYEDEAPASVSRSRRRSTPRWRRRASACSGCRPWRTT